MSDDQPRMTIKFPLTVELNVDQPTLSRVLDADGNMIPNVVRCTIHLMADLRGVYVTVYVAMPPSADGVQRIMAIEGRLGSLRDWKSIHVVPPIEGLTARG